MHLSCWMSLHYLNIKIKFSDSISGPSESQILMNLKTQACYSLYDLLMNRSISNNIWWTNVILEHFIFLNL